MKIAITGATGFLGRYIVSRLADAGHRLTCWYRADSDLSHFPTPLPSGSVNWIEGRLGDERAERELLDGKEAVVHAALHHPGGGFRGNEGDFLDFLQLNLIGSLRLMERARSVGARRFVFISSCAVHDRILSDRPLDEAHPTWAASHYGAHKAAIEAFVHSFGLGQGFPVCALRPTGIYGLAHPPRDSKWYELVNRAARSETVEVSGGGKEVHASDVARGVEILLNAAPAAITGESFNCCDRYISQREVAEAARELSGAKGEIRGASSTPRNQISTEKLGALGMAYGGIPLMEQTIEQLIER